MYGMTLFPHSFAEYMLEVSIIVTSVSGFFLIVMAIVIERSFDYKMEVFLGFSLKTFEDATAFSSIVKLSEELNELLTEMSRGHENLEEEYIDCLMCIIDSAARMGITVDQLNRAFTKKLDKNINRKWKKNDDNTYSHILK